jgi:hypothetical protein
MKGVHINCVTPPGERLSVRGEMQADKVINRSGRPMVARNPFGKNECDFAGRALAGDWQYFVGRNGLSTDGSSIYRKSDWRLR